MQSKIFWFTVYKVNIKPNPLLLQSYLVWKMIHHDHSSYNEYIYAVLKWGFFFFFMGTAKRKIRNDKNNIKHLEMLVKVRFEFISHRFHAIQ